MSRIYSYAHTPLGVRRSLSTTQARCDEASEHTQTLFYQSLSLTINFAESSNLEEGVLSGFTKIP